MLLLPAKPQLTTISLANKVMQGNICKSWNSAGILSLFKFLSLKELDFYIVYIDKMGSAQAECTRKADQLSYGTV